MNANNIDDEEPAISLGTMRTEAGEPGEVKRALHAMRTFQITFSCNSSLPPMRRARQTSASLWKVRWDFYHSFGEGNTAADVCTPHACPGASTSLRLHRHNLYASQPTSTRRLRTGVQGGAASYKMVPLSVSQGGLVMAVSYKAGEKPGDPPTQISESYFRLMLIKLFGSQHNVLRAHARLKDFVHNTLYYLKLALTCKLAHLWSKKPHVCDPPSLVSSQGQKAQWTRASMWHQ